MHILKRLLRLQFVRNICGAAAGAVIALMLYGAYGVGQRIVASVIPAAPVYDTSKEDAARTAKVLLVGARAKAIAETLH